MGPTSCDWRTSTSNFCGQSKATSHRCCQCYVQRPSKRGHLWRGGGEMRGWAKASRPFGLKKARKKGAPCIWDHQHPQQNASVPGCSGENAETTAAAARAEARAPPAGSCTHSSPGCGLGSFLLRGSLREQSCYISSSSSPVAGALEFCYVSSLRRIPYCVQETPAHVDWSLPHFLQVPPSRTTKLFPMAEVHVELPKTKTYSLSFFLLQWAWTDSSYAPNQKVWGLVGFSSQVTIARRQKSRFPSRSTDREPSTDLLAGGGPSAKLWTAKKRSCTFEMLVKGV